MVTLFRLGSETVGEKWFIEVLEHPARSISDPCKSDRSVAPSRRKSRKQKNCREIHSVSQVRRVASVKPFRIEHSRDPALPSNHVPVFIYERVSQRYMLKSFKNFISYFSECQRYVELSATVLCNCISGIEYIVYRRDTDARETLRVSG